MSNGKIWSEIKSNPNLYCWIPVDKKYKPLETVSLSEINVQDVPKPDNFIDRVTEKAELADFHKQKIFQQNFESGADPYSSDEMKKFNLARDFIKKRGLVLYGGSAINMVLPQDQKIYEEGEFPDYDVYSPEPWTNAVEFAQILYDNKYQYVEVKAGIHKGTYKVSANLWPVLDVTFMDKKSFDLLHKVKVDGLYVTAPSRLAEQMYKELSQPFANVTRWPKVAQRLELIEEYNNPLGGDYHCPASLFQGGHKKLDSKHAELLEKVKEYMIKNNLPFSGSQAYNLFLAIAGVKERVLVERYETVCNGANVRIRDMMDKIIKCVDNPKDLHIKSHFIMTRDFNRAYYALLWKDKFLCVMNNIIDVCVPVVDIMGYRVVSIDYLKYKLYHQLAFSPKEDTNRWKCYIKYLDKAQKRYYQENDVSEFDKGPFERFIHTCVGPKINTLKYAILNRIEGIKYGVDCQDRKKDDCNFPCAWSNEKRKCTDIPNSYVLRKTDK